ncbi:ROK family protein [Arenibacter nanhaiticus]|nr:ROK family protein [Arenibacter nanhaiticus]
MKKIVLAIDIGGTNTKIGLVTKEGRILGVKVFETRAKLPYKNFMQKLEEKVNMLLNEHNAFFRIEAIGVGAPNVNILTGNMENPPNLNWGTSVPLTKSIEEIWKFPTIVANDANAAAIGEMTFGMAQGMKNFVMLTLGTGLGSGIVINGQLLTGEHGLAGELGHTKVDPYGRQCNCGLRGCLENYVSVTGIKRTVFELISEMTEDSPLKKLSFDDLKGEMIAEAALNGDPIAIKAFELTGEILGSKLADSVAHLDPEAIILAGGLGNAGDILLNPTVASMEKNLFTAYKGKIKVLISKEPSANSILGPAALAINNLTYSS